MNREERIRAVLEGKQPDRVPVSVWMHLSEYDQDSRSLAEAMVAFNEKYDYDFIKMMPFGAYMTPDWGAKLKRLRSSSLRLPVRKTMRSWKYWLRLMEAGEEPYKLRSGLPS